MQTYEEYDDYEINKAWLTLQTVCNAILEDQGGNDFDVPHMVKDAIFRAEGRLPERVRLTDASIQMINQMNGNN